MNKNSVDLKRKTLFLMILTAFIVVSTATASIVNMAAASPETTHFFVDPLEVRDVPSGGTFLINISVTEAPESYAWETSLGWDPDLLELTTIDEGDFLKRTVPYVTEFIYTSVAEANLAGEIDFGCTLMGDVPWASGEGWLCRLRFTVEATGSCVLNLFDTKLFDHIVAGSPAETYYSNQDGFFFNEAFHDIAVTSVTANTTSVERGETVAFNVAVTNEGNYSETFDVAVYADATAYEYTYDIIGRLIKTTIVVGDEITVGTETVTDLASGATATPAFTWDTTGVPADTYTISAEAIVSDDDTRDNLFIDGNVTVVALPTHDIAITDVVPSPTEVAPGDSVTISVTVENEGSFNETFDVTVYYDGTAIDTETDVSLEDGASTTLTFTWDTAGVAEDTYAIEAEASVVPGETDTDDNTYPGGTVEVREAEAPDILIYVAVAAVAIAIIAAVAIYILKFRK